MRGPRTMGSAAARGPRRQCPAPPGGPAAPGEPGPCPPFPGAPTGPFVRVPGPVGAICQGGPATGRFTGRNLFVPPGPRAGKGATEPPNELISIPRNPGLPGPRFRALRGRGEGSRGAGACGEGPARGFGEQRVDGGGQGGDFWGVTAVPRLQPGCCRGAQLLPQAGEAPGPRGSPSSQAKLNDPGPPEFRVGGVFFRPPLSLPGGCRAPRSLPLPVPSSAGPLLALPSVNYSPWLSHYSREGVAAPAPTPSTQVGAGVTLGVTRAVPSKGGGGWGHPPRPRWHRHIVSWGMGTPGGSPRGGG